MAEQITASTQEHLDILEVKNNLVILKNGTACAVIETTAVNFDLLSEIEQDAIIAAFSMLLNSITFPVQIVLRSKKLDISKYIEKVYNVETKITDPLLKLQAESYRKFVQEVIKQNEVLSKQFFVIIPMLNSSVAFEPGSGPFDWVMKLFGTHTKRVDVDIEKTIVDAERSLSPKIGHIMGEFNRLGIKTKQLSTQELVELYFDIYNPSTIHGQRVKTNIDDYTTAIVNPAIMED
jgi:type IV secretory pathway VirB4 component